MPISAYRDEQRQVKLHTIRTCPPGKFSETEIRVGLGLCFPTCSFDEDGPFHDVGDKMAEFHYCLRTRPADDFHETVRDEKVCELVCKFADDVAAENFVLLETQPNPISFTEIVWTEARAM